MRLADANRGYTPDSELGLPLSGDFAASSDSGDSSFIENGMLISPVVPRYPSRYRVLFARTREAPRPCPEETNRAIKRDVCCGVFLLLLLPVYADGLWNRQNSRKGIIPGIVRRQ